MAPVLAHQRCRFRLELRRGDLPKEKMLLGGNKVGDGKFNKAC